MMCLSSCGGLEKCPNMQALQTTHVTRNTLLNQNEQQRVWGHVQGACFRTNSSSLLLSLPSLTPLPPSSKLLRLFCVVPMSNPGSPTQLDSTVWFRTQTSLVVMLEVAFSTHMRHMSAPRHVCTPIVVPRHASTGPQAFGSNSDLNCNAARAMLRQHVYTAQESAVPCSRNDHCQLVRIWNSGP